MTHKLMVLDPTGHSEFPWDDDGGGLAVAEEVFERKVKREKSVAFATTPVSTRKVSALKDVRPGEDVVIVPQLVGG